MALYRAADFFFRRDKNKRKNIRPLSAGNNNYLDGEFCECTSKNAIKSTQSHERYNNITEL